MDRMSVVSCLRGHFVKHLSYTSSLIPSTLHHHAHQLTPRSHTFTTTSPYSLHQLRTRLNFRNFFSTSATPSASSETPAISPATSAYLSVHIRCPRNSADMLTEALLCFGASSTSIDEQDNFEQTAEICISSVYAVSQDVQKSISHASNSIGLKDTPSYEVKMGYHSDWIKETQESFQPVEVTEGLWIVPEWRTPPDLQATIIILNPGLAFGTGDHPTTKLCLLHLHGLIKGGELLLDYGTGSGILAIAAIKFGASFSVGFDIDPQAITAARHNATLNNIGPEVLQLHLVPSEDSHSLSSERTTRNLEGWNSYGAEVTCGTEKYDVIVANILLNPLLDLADHIVSYAKPGAGVALSGITSEQVPRIIERYSDLLKGITVSMLEDWACVSGTKKTKSTIN